MKKRVKKIPKYNRGTGGIAASVYNAAQKDAPNIFNTQASKDFIQTADNIDLALNQLNPFQTEMNWAEMNSKQRTGSVIGAVGTAANLVSNSIGKKATVGGAINGALQGASAGMTIGGPWGAAIGAVGGAALSSIGTGGNVDMTTGEITMPSGIAGIFGHSKGYLRRKSNMVKNALASRTLTENLKTDYYNNTPGAGSINVLAAEGGIMRQPVDALVSKGELIYNPVTKKLSQVPGSKGKPNKADDVYAKLYEGDVVISNSPTMLMANGKTPAQNLMGMVDKYATGGTVKAREAIIKKVVNWQEANKTKPQEYTMYDEGTGKDGVQKSVKKRRNSIWNRLQDKWNAEAIKDWYGNYYENVDKYEDHKIIDGRLFIKHNGDWYDTHKGGLNRKLLNNQLPKQGEGYTTARHSWVPFKQVVFDDVDAAKIKKHKPTIPVEFVADNMNMTTHPEINNVWSRHKTSDNSISTNDISEVVAYPNDVNNTDNNISAKVKSENGKSVRKKPVVTGTIKNPILPEYDRLSFAEPFQFNNQHLRYAPGNYVPIKPLDVEIKDEIVDEVGLPKGNSKLNINWNDLAYRAAVLTQPLWGRAKTEPVNYTLRNANYIPVGANVKPLHRQADETYSMGRYNFANLGGNTGANMAYGAQLAANRAKQYADAYQWQQNVQNDQIAKNIGIYNDWDTQRTEILNNVYDKNAANRATARNINRQNAAAALKNWGTMLSDDKRMAVERMKFKMLQPAIRSTYEDATANDLINIYNSLFT